MPKKLQKYN